MEVLPLDIIKCISDYLTLQEWARAAGTCKMWWTMRTPLKVLDLSKGANRDELLPLAGNILFLYCSKHS